jgi:hypothetical protein
VAFAIGRVLNGPGSAPVAGATLRWDAIVEPRPASTFITTTGTGDYAVWLPPADRYVVFINNGPSILVLLSTPSRPIDFLMNTGGCPTIYGSVLDSATRAPIAGARVGWVGESVTDANGAYRITVPCGSGSYGFGTTALTITHPAYQSYFTPHARRESLGSSARESRSDYLLTPRQQ